MPEILTATELAAYIREHNIDAEILFLEAETPTVAVAAAVVGAEPDQIGKSILFLVDGRPILVIATGLTRVHYKRLADHLGVSRRRIKLANAEQVLDILGFPVGTVPPFGHRQAVLTLLESNVLSYSQIYAGGGAINALIRLATAELQRVIQAEVVSLAAVNGG
jgi:prolyl-tRNA editing enzyme YbaK/EbsC (Cys-tRNA(Pro) deacylase)